jgi:hypothetical protein
VRSRARTDSPQFSRAVPPFESIELSKHIPEQGKKRGFTDKQARACIEMPDRIIKTQEHGLSGGLIWKFRKSFKSRTLQIVTEVYKNKCYAITGYWLK